MDRAGEVEGRGPRAGVQRGAGRAIEVRDTDFAHLPDLSPGRQHSAVRVARAF